MKDAGAVLLSVGIPSDWRPRVEELARQLPDGELADILFDVVGHEDEPREQQSAAVEPATSGLLYDGQLEPFTKTINYIGAGFEETVAEFKSWSGGLSDDYRDATFTPLEGNLRSFLGHLEPWAAPWWKRLIIETAGPWTVEMIQGTDVGHGRVIADRLRCPYVATSYAPHVVRDRRVVLYGNRSWSSVRAEGSAGRGLQATYQSRWEWHAAGEPLPFENLAAYESKRIPDRFTLAMINDYCAAMGIRRADPSFYGPRAVLMENDTSARGHDPRTLSGEEWRAEHGRPHGHGGSAQRCVRPR